MPARALALSHTEQHVRRNHGHVGKLAELRHARVRRALIPVAGRIHLLSCGRLAMISWIAQEANGDSELNPHGQPTRYKAFGAVLRRESRTRQRVFDSNIFAHGCRQAGDGVAGMPARELRICGCGSCERPARLWETAGKRSIQSLTRPGGSVKEKTQRSEFVFERRGEMVLIRSACIGNFLSSPYRDTRVQARKATMPTMATRATSFEIGPELDPVWTQFVSVSEGAVL